MNSKLLLEKISNDLGIVPFIDETITSFTNRVVYAALGAWLRTGVSGCSYSDLGKDSKGIDVRHIIYRSAQILAVLFEVLPVDLSWFASCVSGSNKSEDVARKCASLVLGQLIFVRELVRLRGSRLISSPIRCANTNEELFLYLGGQDPIPENRSDLISSGLGRWVSTPVDGIHPITLQQALGIPELPAAQWAQYIINGMQWIREDVPYDYMTFRAGCGRWHKDSWQPVGRIISEIPILVRTSSGLYRLIKQKHGKLYVGTLDGWYKNTHEINRLQYALDVLAGAPTTFKYIDYGDRILIHCHSYLPAGEKSLLLLSSWPFNGIKDNYKWIISKSLWPIVKRVLNHTGIVCQEI